MILNLNITVCYGSTRPLIDGNLRDRKVSLVLNKDMSEWSSPQNVDNKLSDL